MKKTLAIYDPHGSEINYDLIDISKYSMIIFGGDYWDSFDRTYQEQLSSFMQMIYFYENNKDKIKIKMLLGNHDTQYLYLTTNISNIKRRLDCKGFQKEHKFKIHLLMKKYEHYFDYFHIDNNVIFSHAGVDAGLVIDLRNKGIKNLSYVNNELLKEFFYIDKSSGGHDEYGGIFWARPSTIILPSNYSQIVGHTYQKNEIPFYKEQSNNSELLVCDVKKFVEIDLDNIKKYRTFDWN